MRPAAGLVVTGLVLLGSWSGPLAAAEAGIETARLDSVVIHPQREAAATVQARNRSRIAAELAAVVRELRADVGDTVTAGDVLALLDDRDARLALEQVQAQVDGLRARLGLAESQLARARQLKSGNFVTTEAVSQRTAEVVGLKADLQAAVARVAVATRQLGKTEIRAPFDAVVEARSGQLGELTSPGAPLFTLVQSGGEEARAEIPVVLADSLRSADQPVFVTAPGREYPVRLVRLSPVVAQATRSRLARFAFLKETPPVGSDGRVRWREPQPHLPASLIVRRDAGLGVFVVRQGRAAFVALPAAQEGRATPVSLPSDSRVVIRGQAGLRSGDPLDPGAS